jgi:hypothetical protein
MARPLIVIDPKPWSLDKIFEPKVLAQLEALGELATHGGPATCRPSLSNPVSPRWLC